MNVTSLLLALGLAVIVAATGAFIEWGARKHGGWSLWRRRVVRILTIVATLLTATWVYYADAEMRGTTLFEVAGTWEENGNRTWLVEVEHPRVEHTLMVSPFTRGTDSAERTLTLRVRFGAMGEPPLVDETVVHETVLKRGKYASTYTWTEVYWSFTPPRADPYELIVTTSDGFVPPLLLLRISDPEKRDGKRAKGY
ncbi:MAG: hypothetical protein KDN18_24680 [Verrucomicrobiae bacterium]|nr:hypothetical protein [Verrucomicrobiae bacterium]